MNRIVRENYPVEKLPEDLRDGLPDGGTVTVTVEEMEKPSPAELHAMVLDILKNPKPMTLKEIREMVGPRSITPEEAVARVRELRDEWDE